MEGRDMIVATVRDFLGDIQQLHREKEGLEAVNPTKATYLQCQMWRKLAVIDSLLNSCPEAKEVVEKEVSGKRKELQVEAEELNTMPIPKAVDDNILQGWADMEKEKREEPFLYQQLPPEVRKCILSYLTSAADQLNFREALPADGDMMGWDDEKALRFQIVLSLLMSRQMLDYEDVKKLVRVGDYVKDAVLKGFETQSKHHFTVDSRRLSTFHKSLICVTEEEFDVDPIPACIELSISTDDDSLGLEAHELQILRQMGHHIWTCACNIFVEEEQSAKQIITRLRDFLELMPNLKYLDLHVGITADREDPRTYWRDVELPELPKLRALMLNAIGCEELTRKIMRKYESHVTRFTGAHWPLYLEGWSYNPRWTKLYQYYEEKKKMEPSAEIARLGKLVGSPLKRVGFYINPKEDRNSDYFRSLMGCLHQFRESLEGLELSFSNKPVSGKVLDLGWLAKIEFPKVSYLSIEELPDTWTFLLQFPSLEKLTWICARGSWTDSFVASDCFSFSWRKREMERSNIWKMLPCLKEIQFCRGEKHVTRTRTEALEYQEKVKEELARPEVSGECRD